MLTMQELRRSLPRPGRVDWIGLREGRRLPVQSVQHAEAHPLVGLLGDHGKTAPGRLRAISGEAIPFETGEEVPPYLPPPAASSGWTGPGKRQVTLIQAEHLPVIAALAGVQTVTPEEMRRNIVVSGLSVLALKDARFQLGEVILEGTGECHPCSRMEETFGAGGYNAVRGHGGITARVVRGGLIRVGDALTVLPD
ncbi:MOSC domain-containing protein [Deinococcus puniceus]|uniref:Molybdenum cofactor biosysynthesis protein n=1 Tax=Deinococcus puniceus TaxID=1182568 RepID=A0A172T663_9DEIO|nr:MOSC domain-containing protein [Deinococcus puniceus]ANE42518.1 molybdenum cofactor biosysynthesis protein [Deinococcus puniceus]